MKFLFLISAQLVLYLIQFKVYINFIRDSISIMI